MSLAQALDEPSKASVSLREGPQRGALHHSSPRLREAGLPSCQWAAFATRGPRRMAHLLTPMADGPGLRQSDSQLLYHMMVQIQYSFSSDVYT